MWGDRSNSLLVIARALGCGTSTILRAANELELPPRPDAPRSHHGTKHRGRQIRRPTGPTVEQFQAPPVVAPSRLLRLDHGPASCQWITNDARPWSFCGKDCKGVYCVEHAFRAREHR